MKKKIRAISGGTGASKTISIIFWCIDYALSGKNEIISIVSESVPHLEAGAIRDFKAIMNDRNYWNDDLWNETKHIYRFETGTIIEFISVDKFGKAHGPRRDVLFLNEANNISFNIADQLIVRTRKVVWLDWNPVVEFWFYTELQGKREDIDFICLTFLDNEAISESERKEIESRRNRPGWWKVYGEGQLGEIEGIIFSGWKIIDEVPHEARLERRWLDFGYTNDQTALGDLYYYNGGYILDEVLYQKGMSNKQIADTILAQIEPKTLVVADSAEPKSIDEIKSYGVNAVGVSKTRGETKQETFVKWSIGIVQKEKISVTKRSINIIKEYRNYLWAVDKDGKVLNVEDPKCLNHHMRGIAYALCNLTPIKQRQERRRQMGLEAMYNYNHPRVNPV